MADSSEEESDANDSMDGTSDSTTTSPSAAEMNYLENSNSKQVLLAMATSLGIAKLDDEPFKSSAKRALTPSVPILLKGLLE